MLNVGMTGFSFVHDSYGTYAPDIDQMHMYLREEFISIHQENQLEKFKQETEAKYGIYLPDSPAREEGFDIKEVKDSRFFFA
jgi:DNA-directed RNA polymerase